MTSLVPVILSGGSGTRLWPLSRELYPKQFLPLPLLSVEYGDRLFISSEEAAIRTMEPQIDKVTMPRAGEPVVGRVVG